MQVKKKSGHSVDFRKLAVQILALLCAVVIVGGSLLAAFG